MAQASIPEIIGKGVEMKASDVSCEETSKRGAMAEI